MDIAHQLPFWLKSDILRYYICDLTPSDLISLYAHPCLVEILEQLNYKEWVKIYRNNPKMIVVGKHYHHLALKTDGQIVAWGDDHFGQCTNIPDLPEGIHYVDVSAGQAHSLAIRSDGQIVAWGNNGHGQCTNIPVATKGTYYLSVSVGGYHNLALNSDGQIVAWKLETKMLECIPLE